MMRPVLGAGVLATALLLAACGGDSAAPAEPMAPAEPAAPAEPVAPDAPAAPQLFPQVEAIVRARCLACHSVTPAMPGFASAPRGIRYDSADQIRADALRIYVNVVQLQFMPYGNRTGMTADEREVVRRWYEDEVR